MKNETIARIRNECNKQGLMLLAQHAYVVATADHETNGTFKPVREAYWLKDPDSYLRTHHADYYPYYGRGYVQLTWKRNYLKYQKLLAKPLVDNPDLALDPATAVFILVHGFKTGAFTGKKLTDYINDESVDFMSARRCINGTDAALKIAAKAYDYERIFRQQYNLNQVNQA